MTLLEMRSALVFGHGDHDCNREVDVSNDQGNESNCRAAEECKDWQWFDLVRKLRRNDPDEKDLI